MKKSINPVLLALALIVPGVSLASDTALQLAKQWRETPSSVYLAEAGKVVFPFGETLHTITCAPLRQCDIQLQAGEKVNNVKLGDTVRWKIEGARSGPEGAQIVHLVIKPTQADLDTALVITTDRRAYHLRLTSHATQWMPVIAFSYPEELDARLAGFLAEEKQRQADADRRKLQVEDQGLRVEDLDFNYVIDGKSPWRPTRVFADGAHTYVDLPKAVSTEDAPILLVMNQAGQRVVNYRVHDRRYIVDGVFQHMELIAGVGKAQEKVTIKRVAP
jgi:type IV secretion system protein VirB9